LPAGGLEVVDECAGSVLLIGTGTAAAATLLAGRVTAVRTIEAGPFAPSGWVDVLAAHVADEAHVVLPASPDGRDLAPRLAAVLHRELLAGAIAVAPHSVDLARRGGLVIHSVRPAGAFVATLQPGVRGVDAAPESALPVVDQLDVGAIAADRDATVVEVLAPDAATMDLAESPRILGGGAGLASKESFEQLADLATRLDASMGATRVITDRGWIGHERQIGTTGVVVDPALYIAFGISGAVQHTSGLGQPAHIISVNTDPHCPMMQLADLAIVSDANAVATELLARMAVASG
jgi:electron transfer flavoprotein alpha subunit